MDTAKKSAVPEVGEVKAYKETCDLDIPTGGCVVESLEDMDSDDFEAAADRPPANFPILDQEAMDCPSAPVASSPAPKASVSASKPWNIDTEDEGTIEELNSIEILSATILASLKNRYVI